MNDLATPQFSALLAADPALKELRNQLIERKNFAPDTFDALLLSGCDHIGALPVLPLTLAKWSFLWIVENPIVTGKDQIDETAINVFLYVLSSPDLRKLNFPLPELPVQARDYSRATGLDLNLIWSDIKDIVKSAFYPLKMIPKPDDPDQESFYDGAWITWVASIAVRESGIPYDRVIHELPLSLVCNFYVSYLRRETVDGGKIKRPQNGKIMDQIIERVNFLAQEFLKNKGK